MEFARKPDVAVRGLRSAWIAAGFCAAAGLGGCASRSEPGGSEIGAAIEQPFRDLNLVQDEPTQVILKAAARPYASPANCSAAAMDLRRLDRALGADVDADPETASSTEGLPAGLVRAVASLPFRGLVRRITGAEKADREARQAVIAAVARRGYLRGWLQAGECAGAPVAAVSMPSPREFVGS